MRSHSLHIDDQSTHGHVHPLYPIKVWLTALFVVAPCCLWLKNGLAYGDFGISMHDLGSVILIGMSGLILSLPVYGILFLTFRLLTQKNISTIHIRWILDTICVLGIFITFKLVDENPDLVAAVCYSFSVIIASLLYKIYSPLQSNMARVDE